MTLGSPKQEMLICFSDFILLCKKAKRKILFAAAFFACAAVMYALTTPVEYIATSTFREKGKSQAGLASSNLSMLLSGNSSPSQSEAISMMKSRTLLEELAKHLSLQATLTKNTPRFGTIGTMRDNLLIEYALFKKKQGPFFSDSQRTITVEDISYAGDVTLGMKVKFLTDDTFQIYPAPEGLSNIGTVGVPFVTPNATFTIVRLNTNPLIRHDYTLSIEPLDAVVRRLMSKITIETDHDDKGLLKLQFANADRHEAAKILNTLMVLYQDYLGTDQHRILREQVAYLQDRHDKMQGKLKAMMEDHADKLSVDLAKTGFPNTNKAMEFLATAQQEYTRNLLGIDLELKRLENVEQDGSAYYERYVSEGSTPTVINQIVSQIRQLKQQADSLELALREALLDNHDALKEQENIALQFIELTRVRQSSEEAKLMLASLAAGNMPDSKLRLYHDNRFMVKNWCDRLIENKNKTEEYSRCTNNFTSYLNNLLHLFHVHEKAIQERLTHQQTTPIEFQGIDLATAKELYINYSKELNELEADITQERFIVTQLEDPSFEISSLSTVLNDSVSSNMINSAGLVLLQLKDQNNRSLKEQERLKSDLAVQKGFLAVHLNQTIQLLQLRENLLREKIQALQSATLGLIQQEISVLQEHLAEHVKTRIGNLQQERDVIEQHQQELQHEMAKLPSKWVSEKMIEQQVEVNKRMVEEITRLVESKNITSNLELIQSAPVDYAISPVHPRSPRLMMFMLLGLSFGALLMVSWGVVRTLTNGIPVTSANLKLSNMHVSGNLSPQCSSTKSKNTLLDQDLGTLRRIASFLKSIPIESGTGRLALLMIGNGPDYSHELAHLLEKSGFKILLVNLAFDRIASVDELPGVLQYLENPTVKPKIIHMECYDAISSGGISRFVNELLGTAPFVTLLSDLQKKYDWTFAISHGPLNSSETQHLLHQFNAALITIEGQTWNDLEGCLQIMQTEAAPKHLSFVLSNGEINAS